jgi:hypothetical protein
LITNDQLHNEPTIPQQARVWGRDGDGVWAACVEEGEREMRKRELKEREGR